MKSLSQHPHICEILLWSKDSGSKPSNDSSCHLIAQVRLKSYDHRYVIPRRNIVTTSFVFRALMITRIFIIMINSTKSLLSLVNRNLVAASESVAHTLIRLPIKHHLIIFMMIKLSMMIMLMMMMPLMMIIIMQLMMIIIMQLMMMMIMLSMMISRPDPFKHQKVAAFSVNPTLNVDQDVPNDNDSDDDTWQSL